MSTRPLTRLARTRIDSLMPRCFACIHCGKCGPPSSDAKVKPAGWCIFCRTQNEVDAKVCANCGKPLPKIPGSFQRNTGGGER